jgi:hypothetical protein
MRALWTATLLLIVATTTLAQDTHWSRQFPKPKKPTEMLPGTGMSDGGGKPTASRVKWHEGKLWIGGSWEPGVDGDDPSRQRPNVYWKLWTWSPTAGWEAVCWFHTAQGGVGPDGTINDFLWLPDGRLVVGGEFTRLYNPGGNRYRGVNALAVYDPKEPTANRWRPLGTFQYNGTVSSGGSIQSLAYDPQGNDLYIGGTFGGIPLPEGERSPFVHRYDLDTGGYEPMAPGLVGAKPSANRIVVDTSTKPSTIYVAGKFHYTAGNGLNLANASSTARYSTGLAAWQEGTGWRTFPTAHPRGPEGGGDEGILQRAADYARFDAVHVLDLLVDGKDIWIVGAFSQGTKSGETLRGIARWDEARQVWADPTGKGGLGREAFSIGKGKNGKIYVAGAFGGRRTVKDNYDGFKDGTPAALAVSYDPATKSWAQLGAGLASRVMPECRLAIDGDDVWFVGDFDGIDPAKQGTKELVESAYVARWNETVDFVAAPPQVAAAPQRAARPRPERPAFTGNEHWSRQFAPPERGKPMTGKTGMDDSAGKPTQTNGVVVIGDTVYFGGNWEVKPGQRWYVWSWHPTKGWAALASQQGAKSQGIESPPLGLATHGGKLYAYGAIARWNGIGVYDPKTEEWTRLAGTFGGKPVDGNAMTDQGDAPIKDVCWGKDGTMYLVGSCGLAPGCGPAFTVGTDGAFTPLGKALLPEDPSKPIVSFDAIALDESTTPPTIYIGGTFNYFGGAPTSNERMCFNVARFDRQASDWRPVGKGVKVGLSPLDAPKYPDGLPGLPAHSDRYQGFIHPLFPRVRDLVVDGQGNLWAGGTLALVDESVPVAARRETFGLAKWDKATDRWVGPTKAGGVTRDVSQLTLLADGKLLLSGSFVQDERWGLLNNVALLDPATGVLAPLGGGLLREGLDQTIGATVAHCVSGDDLWFFGFFDHAGVNADDLLDAPVRSSYVARWNPTQDLDPNRGLQVAASPVELAVPAGPSSSEAEVTLTASGADGATITWYERKSDGQFVARGAGPSWKSKQRVKAGDELTLYVTATRDGVEGGKRAIRLPVRGR